MHRWFRSVIISHDACFRLETPECGTGRQVFGDKELHVLCPKEPNRGQFLRARILLLSEALLGHGLFRDDHDD